MSSSLWRELAETGLKAAALAGETTLRYFRSPGLAVDTKSDRSPVTIADRSAENIIVGCILKEYPDHGILGEESGERPGSRIRWIIDPIDGTKSFIHGVPLYGVMVAAEDREINEVVFGVVHFPALNETYYAVKDVGAFFNHQPCRVSGNSSLKDAVLLTTDYRQVAGHEKAAAFERLQQSVKFSRTWGDCYGHMLVASGRAEIMMDPRMNIWDIAALKPIVEEAGGRFFDWNGGRGILGTDAISTNAALYEDVMHVLQT